MTSLFRSIDYRSGDIQHIEEDITLDPADRQIDLLREDLLQVHYSHGQYILDVGWYPSFDTEGEFCVTVIEGVNWDAPFYERHTKDTHELKNVIQHAVAVIENKQQ